MSRYDRCRVRYNSGCPKIRNLQPKNRVWMTGTIVQKSDSYFDGGIPAYMVLFDGAKKSEWVPAHNVKAIR